MSKLDFPQLFRVRQRFSDSRLQDVESTIRQQLLTLSLKERIRPGQTVALTAGSRGIHQIANILRVVVDCLREIGAEPFIVPAMGSHGGGTSDGQVQVLKSLGISEETCNCSIRSSMETVVVCQATEGFPVHFDRHAFGADHVLVCNRIKPHTRFNGDLQSGLMKMMLIGLGKHHGAEIYHRAIQDFTFGQIVRSVAKEVLQRCRIVGGLAIIENAFDQTAMIEAVMPDHFASREAELLRQAESLMPRLPFDAADLLVVNEIGKNLSGTGMDTNVIGRKFNDHAAMGEERPAIKYIFVRGLTAATHGNATGIGAAEFTLQRLADQVDPVSTATNCITANHPTGAMIPITFPNDRQAISAALGSIGLRDPADTRVMWIENTLQLAELECSAPYLNAAKMHEQLEVLCEPRPMPFDGDGNLPQSLSAA